MKKSRLRVAGDYHPVGIQSEFPYRDNMNYLCLGLRGWCFLAGFVYLVLGLSVIVLYFTQNIGLFGLNRLWAPVTQTVVLEKAAESVQHSWQDGNLGPGVALGSSCSLLETYDISSSGRFLKPLVLNYGTLDVRVCLIALFFVSAFFSFADCIDRDTYYKPLEKGRCHLSHYVEGSFSLPIMVLIMCAVLGVTDLMTLLGAACNAWCCMVFSQLAEVLSQGGDGVVHFGGIKTFEYHVIAHFSHWISFIASVSVFLSNSTVRDSCVVSSGTMSNQYITSIIAAYLIVVLFAMFGLVQAYVLYVRAHEFGETGEAGNVSYASEPSAMKVRAAFHSEFACITLGLFTRVLLGLFVYVGGAV